jgi:predicted nucleotidyltransferase component of viral defense system
MPYQSDADFRQALEERLRRVHRERGQPLLRLRKRVVFERCLARLQQRPDSPWVLKGGVALELRLGSRARMTQDLDLGVSQSIAEQRNWSGRELAQALRLDLGAMGDDRFEFIVPEADEVEPLIAAVKAYRFSVEARLSGRRFETIRVDVGLGDTIVPPADMLAGSDVLAFAGIPAPQIRATSRAQHLAEKVHALTRPIGDRINTRVKDLADVMLLMDLGLPEPSVVRSVVEEIFTTRRHHEIPHTVGPLPVTWVSSFTAMASELGLVQTKVESATARLNEYWGSIFSSG